MKTPFAEIAAMHEPIIFVDGEDMVRGELVHDPQLGWIGKVDWSTQDVWESYPPAVACSRLIIYGGVAEIVHGGEPIFSTTYGNDCPRIRVTLPLLCLVLHRFFARGATTGFSLDYGRPRGKNLCNPFFLDRHRPLPRGVGIRHRASSALSYPSRSRSGQITCSRERSDHVLPTLKITMVDTPSSGVIIDA
jgi:hypothetical protein